MIQAWGNSRGGRYTSALGVTMEAGLAALEGRHDDAQCRPTRKHNGPYGNWA